MPENDDHLAAIVRRNSDSIASEWARQQQQDLSLRNNLLKPGEVDEQTREFLNVLTPALADSSRDISSAPWEPVREYIGSMARSRARQGFTPAETATFLFSLKQSIFRALQRELADNPQRMSEETWTVNELLDRLGLYSYEVYQKGREEVIMRQQQELVELSTPVVQLWAGVLALPLIGTLDSARTQVVMESLLQAIVETGSAIAIIDITGVPLVDTLVAQHLLKTIAAARLMGADCIISGIRPQIAQTIVHLGVELSDVITKATLADAFAIALSRVGMAVVRRGNAAAV